MEKRAFWIIDNANKFLQLQAIVKSNYSDYSLPWPGNTIDPELHCNPLPPNFSVVKNGSLFSIFSPVFAVISSFPFRLWGFWGLYVLPSVSSIIMLVALAKIAEKLSPDTGARHIAVLIAGLCTPIWFYSVVFWEHIIAVCLCLWGIYFHLQFLSGGRSRQLVWGTVLASFSIYLRDELYLFCLVLLGVLLLYSPGRRARTTLVFMISMIVTVAPLWLFQWRTIGHPFGFHLGFHLFSASGILGHLSDRPVVFYRLFVTASSNLWLSLTLAAPFVVMFLWNPKLPKNAFLVAVPLCCLAAVASSVFVLGGYFLVESPIGWLLGSNSLFAAIPVLILAFLRYKDAKNSIVNLSLAKWLWLVAFGYAVAYALSSPEWGSIGIHWSNRFLLVLYPIIALLATGNLLQWFRCTKGKIKWGAPLVAATILMSFAAQAYSITLLQRKKKFSYRLNQAIQKRSEQIIVTDQHWVSQELFSEFYNKSIFFVYSEQQADLLTRRLLEQGHTKWLLVSQKSGEDAKRAAVEVRDEALNFFSLQFYVINARHER